jgi:predicted ATP-grasp superfamily ATP-dependent carboligase
MQPKASLESPVHKVSVSASPRRLDGVGAVVIGGDFQGLGIARSLGRRGIPVCIIDDEHSIARYSRYATHFVRVKDLRDEQETIRTVLDIGRRFKLQDWVLYPTRDETVAAFSLNHEILSQSFRVPTPKWNIIQWAWDKRKTHELALKLGIGTPKTWFPNCIQDLAQIDAKFPLVIKPAIKEHFFYQTGAKAWRADNRGDLMDCFQRAAGFVPSGEIMIQDLIPGGSEQLFGCCAFFKGSSAVGTMVTQYKRQHPPLFGRSCTLVETVEHPEVEALAHKFLKAMDYYGLVELEFKLDSRDGQYKLLDVNARTWGYHALGATAGVDFSSMLFEDQIEKNVRPKRARPGITWIRLATDFPVGILAVLRRQISPLAYLKSVTTFDAESVFTFDDPLPSVAEVALIPYLFYKRGY